MTMWQGLLSVLAICACLSRVNLAVVDGIPAVYCLQVSLRIDTMYHTNRLRIWMFVLGCSILHVGMPARLIDQYHVATVCQTCARPTALTCAKTAGIIDVCQMLEILFCSGRLGKLEPEDTPYVPCSQPMILTPQ